MRLILLLFFAFTSLIIYCQTDDLPMNSSDFNAQIQTDIEYAIFGESNAFSGIKVDLVKPEASVSGVFKKKDWEWSLFGLELSGKVKNNEFSLFKGFRDAGSAFSLKGSLHRAAFRCQNNSRGFLNQDKLIYEAEIARLNKLINAKQDSFCVAMKIFNLYISNEDKFKQYEVPISNYCSMNSFRNSQLLVHFVNKIITGKRDKVDTSMSITKIVDAIEFLILDDSGKITEETYYPVLFSLYEEYKDFDISDLEPQIEKTNIETADKYWKSKNYNWWSFTPSITVENVNQLYSQTTSTGDSTFAKKDNEIYYGAQLSYSNYHLNKSRNARYFVVGAALNYSNNVEGLTPVFYENRKSLDSTSQIFEINSGSAFKSTNFKETLVYELFGEYYKFNLKNLPGYFVSTRLKLGKINNLNMISDRQDDGVSVRVECGIIYNVENKEKKNGPLFAITLFTRFEDITDGRRTSIASAEIESNEDFLKRNLGFGLRVGIPINLPKT